MALIRLEEPITQCNNPRKFALFALGFRPFYLMAALFAAITIPVWTIAFFGVINLPFAGIWWHAHEMLFGFAAAVIVGFLFTAGKVWTGIQTPTGRNLAALCLLWLGGRIAMAWSAHPLAAMIDVSFLWVCALIFMRILLKAHSRRNYFIGALLVVLGLANFAFHAARFEWISANPLTMLHLALALIVILETIIAGRIVPMFTANAAVNLWQWRNKPFDYACITLTAIALLCWIFGAPTPLVSILALLAAVTQLVRSIGWNPWSTIKKPILWVLHLSHLWIPVGLLLVAANAMSWVPRSTAVHALAIGSMGGLIIAMITRTALGHTGRPLQGSPIEATAYSLIHLAALIRVVSTSVIPAAMIGGIHAASTVWSIAFLLYFFRYLPWLIRPRKDGRPG